MVPGPIEAVDKDALQALIDNQVPEGKTIEYKREIPSTAESKMIPLLATVSSFANTARGDLLIGIEADKGVPTKLLGVKTNNTDEETLRLEQVLRSGIEPRLPLVDIRPIAIGNDKHVWAIRVHNSWTSPHRVIRNSKFYARNSAGRYELDVGELRTSFNLSETVADRIRDFRTDRIARIHSRQTPFPIESGGCMVVHVLPLNSFLANTAIDVAKLYGHTEQLRPIGASGWDSRINLDGIVNFASSSYSTYVQVFRSGAIESVSALPRDNDRMIIRSVAYERALIKSLREYMAFAGIFEIDPPYYVFLSFLSVSGCRFGVQGSPTLQEDMLILPEVVVQNRDEKPHEILRPIFDMVWNSFGFPRSKNYNDSGDWVG